jgi:hypothetical protein
MVQSASDGFQTNNSNMFHCIQDPTSTPMQRRKQPVDLGYYNDSVRDCADVESGAHRGQGTYCVDERCDSEIQVSSLDDVTRRHDYGTFVVPFSPKDAPFDSMETWNQNRPRAYAQDFSSPTSVLLDPSCTIDIGHGEHRDRCTTTLRHLVNFFPLESTEALPWIPVVATTPTIHRDVERPEANHDRKSADAVMIRLEEGLKFLDNVHAEPEPAEDSTFSASFDQLVLIWELVRNGNTCRSGASCEVYPGSKKDHPEFAFHLSV